MGDQKQTGKVKWFKDEKGFGFITPDAGGVDLFVHFSCIKSEGYYILGEGEEVEFEIKTSDSGRTMVTNVTAPGGKPFQGIRSSGGYGGGGILGEGEKVEFGIQSSDDGRTKAANVTAPGGNPAQGI